MRVLQIFLVAFCLGVGLVNASAERQPNNAILAQLDELSHEHQQAAKEAETVMLEQAQAPFFTIGQTASVPGIDHEEAGSDNPLPAQPFGFVSNAFGAQGQFPHLPHLGFSPAADHELAGINRLASELRVKQATVAHQRAELKTDANKLRRLAQLLRSNRDVLARNEKSLTQASANYLRAVQRYTARINNDVLQQLKTDAASLAAPAQNAAPSATSLAPVVDNAAADAAAAASSFFQHPVLLEESVVISNENENEEEGENESEDHLESQAEAEALVQSEADAEAEADAEVDADVDAALVEIKSFGADQLEAEVESENAAHLEAEQQVETDAETDAAIASVVDTDTLAQAWAAHEDAQPEYHASNPQEIARAALAIKEASVVEKFVNELEDSDQQEFLQHEREQSAL